MERVKGNRTNFPLSLVLTGIFLDTALPATKIPMKLRTASGG